jgi:hypothetical protein
MKIAENAFRGSRMSSQSWTRNELQAPTIEEGETPKISWSERYGQRHRLTRITDFPAGVRAPQKVRLYARFGHFVLQWWDPAAKKNLSDRVDGDLVSAIARARQIEEKLTSFRSAGLGARRLSHHDLVERFLTDLGQRADAGSIDLATVQRYATALAHYQAYCAEPEIRKAFPHVAGVNRHFRLGFSAFLAHQCVASNGRATSASRPMKAQAFILDTVRAMLEWAADPDRGNLLPDGFRNPFLRRGEPRAVFQGDPLGEPDISLPMALDLMHACDRYQLLLFAPMLLFGLRASEPCFLFQEYFEGTWLKVSCNPDLGYRTKGRRDKRLPLITDLHALWDALKKPGKGLLYLRRAVLGGQATAPLLGCSLTDMITQFRRRCEMSPTMGAVQRQQIRDAVFCDAGGIRYDHIEHEFGHLSQRLGWPAAATLKDLRHLFATTLGNSTMPEAYRRYLMGQNPGQAAVVAYTHLNQIHEHYAAAVRSEWTPLVEAIRQRLAKVT